MPISVSTAANKGDAVLCPDLNTPHYVRNPVNGLAHFRQRNIQHLNSSITYLNIIIGKTQTPGMHLARQPGRCITNNFDEFAMELVHPLPLCNYFFEKDSCCYVHSDHHLIRCHIQITQFQIQSVRYEHFLDYSNHCQFFFISMTYNSGWVFADFNSNAICLPWHPLGY